MDNVDLLVWGLKSPTTWLFIQQCVQDKTKGIIRTRYYLLFVGAILWRVKILSHKRPMIWKVVLCRDFHRDFKDLPRSTLISMFGNVNIDNRASPRWCPVMVSKWHCREYDNGIIDLKSCVRFVLKVCIEMFTNNSVVPKKFGQLYERKYSICIILYHCASNVLITGYLGAWYGVFAATIMIWTSCCVLDIFYHVQKCSCLING